MAIPELTIRNVSLGKRSVTPVARLVFWPVSQTHFSKSEFKNEISSSALLDIQMILLCVCGVISFIPELEYLIEKILRSLFQKEAFEIRFMDSDSWNEAEVNFFRREKLSWRVSQVTCEGHVKWVTNEKSRKDRSMSKGVTMSHDDVIDVY